jgi:hypothetical protein
LITFFQTKFPKRLKSKIQKICKPKAFNSSILENFPKKIFSGVEMKDEKGKNSKIYSLVAMLGVFLE